MITMISAFSRLSKKHLVKSVYVLELKNFYWRRNQLLLGIPWMFILRRQVCILSLDSFNFDLWSLDLLWSVIRLLIMASVGAVRSILNFLWLVYVFSRWECKNTSFTSVARLWKSGLSVVDLVRILLLKKYGLQTSL